MINLIQKVHNKNFIFGNLTPCIFGIGSDTEDKLLYLKDPSFLLTKDDWSKVLKFPILGSDFLSPVCNLAKGPSQIDDLYSMAYLLLYLINGK